MLNILTENPCQPPWYERPYVRVDWAKNLALPFEMDRLTNNAIEAEPLAYYAVAPDDPLAPEVDLRGTAAPKRLSVVTLGLARLRSCGDGGVPADFPECLSLELDPVSCDLHLIQLRQVFELKPMETYCDDSLRPL